MHDRGIGLTLFCLVMLLAFIPVNAEILKKEGVTLQKLPCFSMKFNYIMLWLVYGVLQVQIRILAQIFLRPQIHTHTYSDTIFWTPIRLQVNLCHFQYDSAAPNKVNTSVLINDCFWCWNSIQRTVASLFSILDPVNILLVWNVKN